MTERLKPWHTGTHLRVLSKSYPMNANMTGFRWFSKKIIGEEQTLERNNNLSKALKTLTKKQRKVLFLRFNQDRTYQEISEIMGVSIETARTSIYRAIKTLRKLK